MRWFKDLLGSVTSRDAGQALVEYALIVGTVSIIAVGALTLIGADVTSFLSLVAGIFP